MSDLFPPVEYESTRNGRRFARLRAIPFRIVLPNVVTLLALVAGLTAIRMALEGRWEWAIGGVVLAAVLDAVDGRVARWLKGMSKFGAELDSLADFVNFGVVPALLLYIWLLHDLGSLGWIAAIAYAIAAALRLARFNVMLDKPKPDWHANFFTGMPAPAGATTVLLPIYLNDFLHVPGGPVTAAVVAVYTLAIGFMMVSTIPTFSGKKMGTRIRKELVIPVSVAVVIAVALLVAYPFAMMSVLVLVYLGFIPVVRSWYKRLDAADRAAQAAAARPQATEASPAAPSAD